MVVHHNTENYLGILSPEFHRIRGIVCMYYVHMGVIMAISVRLEPALEARVEAEARRLEITKSQFVKDALERTLGLKNPAEIL